MTNATTHARHTIEDRARETTVAELQKCLVDLIDLQLQTKQAHWNLIGKRFYSMHLQLDEVNKTARQASDDVAERIVALDGVADGRASTLVADSNLDALPDGRPNVEQVVTLIADRLATVAGTLRQGIERLQDVDAVSENMLQDFCQQIEKHLWMIQSQEED
jgi:starvation-inducible DNA-binding protein